MNDDALFPEATRQLLADLISTDDDREAVAMVADLHPAIAAGLLQARSESRAGEGKGMGNLLSGRPMPPALAAGVLQGRWPLPWVYDAIIAGRLLYLIENIGALIPKPEEQRGDTCVFRHDGGLFSRMAQHALVDPTARLHGHVKEIGEGRFEVPLHVALRASRGFQQMADIAIRMFDENVEVVPDPATDWK